MKTPCLFCLLGTLFIWMMCINLSVAQDSFHVYAPSRSTQDLLVIRARVKEPGVELEIAARVPLGFPAATICRHPNKAVLYVAPPQTRWDAGKSTTPGAMVRLDQSGACREVDSITLKHGYAYMSTDQAGNFLLGSNYHDGQLDVYRLQPSGLIDAHVVTVDEGRRNAHCILTSPDNRFLYVPYVKQSNALYQYRFDRRNGEISALKPRNVGPPEGTGPRHIAYHPALPVIYFSNEQPVGVSVYAQKPTGQLVFKQLCDAVPEDRSKEGLSASDIVITPDGRFVFSAIRGSRQNFDRVAGYRVKKDGALELLGLTQADGIPWGMTLSPKGRFLLVSCFEGESLLVYAIGSDGSLERVGRVELPRYISDLVTH